MTSWQIWNNPLVISAFRVRYRRSAPMYVGSLYILVAFGSGLLIKYYEATLQLPLPWERFYFVLLLALQYILSICFAVSSTHSSMNMDVANRTFDFQRIAAMPPRDILLGKLFGEPAVVFLLAFASIPMLVWCATLGAVSGSVLAFTVVNLFSTTLFAGVLGLIHSLEPRKWNSSHPLTWIILFGVFVVPWVVAGLSQVGNAMGSRWSAAVGLFIPVGSVYGVVIGDVWNQGVVFFGRVLPYLVVTPIAQLMAGSLIFHAMCRRLVSPILPLLSKSSVYGVVLCTDVLIAGLLYDDAPGAGAIDDRAIIFCGLHVVATMLATFASTAGRDCLSSWIWRFRGERPLVADLLLGKRTPNVAMGLVFGVIGLACLWLGVVLPAHLAGYALSPMDVPLAVSVAVVLLPMTHAAVYQAIIILFASNGGLLFCLFGVVYLIAPAVVAKFLEIDSLPSISPLSHLIEGFDGDLVRLNPLPMFVIYLVALCVGCLWIRNWLVYHASQVEAKLRDMGVVGVRAGVEEHHSAFAATVR